MKTIESVVLAFLFNASWQIALIAAAAAVASRMLRRFPALPRHAVWVAALVIALLLPAAQIAGRRARPAANVPVISQPLPSQTSTASQSAVSGTSALDTAASRAAGISAASNPANWRRDLQVGQKLAFAVIALYAGLMLWRLACLALAWNRARMLAKRAQFVKMDARLRDVLSACARAFPRRNVSLITSTEIAAPATIGWLRPRIILPEQLLLGSDADSLTAAIGHEMAHIARRDYLLNLVCEFLYVPLAFHFAAALVRRQIRRTRELRCDEMVTQRVLSAERYARALVELAGSAIPRSAVTLAVGVNDGDILEERIVATLRRPKMTSSAKSLTIAAAVAAFVLPCAAAMPFALKVGIRADAPPKVDPVRFELQSISTPSDALATAAVSSEIVPAQPNASALGEAARDDTPGAPRSTAAHELKQRIEQITNNGQETSDRGYAIQQNTQAEKETRERQIQELEQRLNQAKQAVEQDEQAGVNADRDRKTLRILESQLSEARRTSENYKVQFDRLQAMVGEVEAKLAHDEQSGVNTEQDQKILQELRQKLESAQSAQVEVEPGRLYLKREGASPEAVEKLHQLEEALAQAQQQYSPDHPEVQRLKAQLAELQQKLEQESVGWQREREEQMKQRQLELAGKAKISMSDAIQIALQSRPGTVMQCALQSERDMIFYNVGIFGDVAFSNKDANGKPMTTTVKTVTSVLVDAIDGHIIQPERGELKMERH